jgi:hypothetical protein
MDGTCMQCNRDATLVFEFVSAACLRYTGACPSVGVVYIDLLTALFPNGMECVFKFRPAGHLIYCSRYSEAQFDGKTA